jgi:hypothetical protein
MPLPCGNHANHRRELSVEGLCAQACKRVARLRKSMESWNGNALLSSGRQLC